AKVIAVTMPRAPRPIRAAAKTSGFSFSEQVSTEPLAVTSSSARIWAAMEPESRPVPCVPVLTAPDTVCSMMSPMLASDRPSRASATLSRFSGVPASTVTVPAARSISRIPVSRPGRTSSPSVAAMEVNECPVPTALTGMPSSAARRTAAASSSTEAGVTSRAGRTVTLPPQLRHVPFFALTVLTNGASPTRSRPLEPAVPQETDHDRDGPGHGRDPVPGTRPGRVDHPAGRGGAECDPDREPGAHPGHALGELRAWYVLFDEGHGRDHRGSDGQTRNEQRH